jgi:Domain of unknown function (DUF5348)
MERMHEGILYQDQHKRYCLYEPGVPEYKRLTCTSGCRLEIWLNRAWIAGHVEGDGEDYWLFADGGGRFLLAERMKARYIEHHWRSNMRDISGICSSSSIRIMRQKWRIYGLSDRGHGDRLHSVSGPFGRALNYIHNKRRWPDSERSDDRVCWRVLIREQKSASS